MDRLSTQTSIGKGMREEVRRLEIILFGEPMGGWPITGLNIGLLREKVKNKRDVCLKLGNNCGTCRQDCEVAIKGI